MAGADEVRAAQRATWDGLSASWEKWDAVIMDQLGPVTTAMVGSLDLAGSPHHLDVASGTGEPGLTVARIAPRGRVVLTDLSEAMLDVARRRAAAHGVRNVETRVCGADSLPFHDATFDSVSVRFGLMFFPDLPAACAELARVLAPGGRLVSSVWVRPDENPWTSLAMQVIAAEIPLPATDPDGPHMYRCAAPGFVADLYAGAGLGDVAEWDVPVTVRTSSPEEYWQMISEHVSLAAAALRSVDGPTRRRIGDEVVRRVSVYEQNGEVHVPGVARCIVGTR